MKSAIFSSLGDIITDAMVLDLFCGTGAFGIEAISRGAKFCSFIDKDVTALNKNISLLETEQYKVIKGDYFKRGSSLSQDSDIIFIDPPYNLYSSLDILDVIKNNMLIADNGVIVYEERKDYHFRYDSSCFVLKNKKQYGDTVIYFIRGINGDNLSWDV